MGTAEAPWGSDGSTLTPSPPACDSKKLIIALDFGTTFSGVAYCFPHQRESKVICVQNWPGAEGKAVPKIPTVVAYTKDHPNDKNLRCIWGALVKDGTEGSIHGLKLLLDPSQDKPWYIPKFVFNYFCKKPPKPTLELAADFISALYSHSLDEIAKTVPGGYLESCQRELVLSVPAVWSDKAKDSTMKAAHMAGFSPATLIKEPEAAAMYTIRCHDFALQVGDAFVVCDAGGGTVDLISYEVTELNPSLKLKELVPGTGGVAGSLILNQRFEESVKNLVGDQEFERLRKTQGYSYAIGSFDREVKTSFRGHSKDEYFVNFPLAGLRDDPKGKLQANCWIMTGDDVKAIFDPVIAEVLRFVDGQVKSIKAKRKNKDVTGIFLVGGFGSSHYLKSKIQEQHPDTQVFQPPDAWAAVVKGAVQSRLPREPTVVTTLATKHYGFTFADPYDHEVDSGVQSFFDTRQGVDYVYDRMCWVIQAGDTIQHDQEIKHSFYKDIEESRMPAALLFNQELYECNDPDAPTHLCKGNDITVSCEIIADLRSIPKDKFQRNTGANGKTSCKVSFDLVLKIESALMTFRLEVNGRCMGSVEAKFT